MGEELEPAFPIAVQACTVKRFWLYAPDGRAASRVRMGMNIGCRMSFAGLFGLGGHLKSGH